MSDQPTIRIVTIDDHDMLRSGLEVFIETCDDLLLVGESSSGEEGVEVCAALQPDIVLIDLIMPQMDGVTAIRLIRERCPATRLIALTSFNDETLVQAAIQAGAISYLLKNVSIDELATAIRDAHRGKSTLSREAAQSLVSATQRPSVESYNLTRREQEVLALMIRGMSNTEIAANLIVSRSTVKKHVSNVLSKLSSSTRTEAVAIAVQYKLVPS